MTPEELRDVENRLWGAADQMWANTGLMLFYVRPILDVENGSQIEMLNEYL